jgi:hypothetical protein
LVQSFSQNNRQRLRLVLGNPIGAIDFFPILLGLLAQWQTGQPRKKQTPLVRVLLVLLVPKLRGANAVAVAVGALVALVAWVRGGGLPALAVGCAIAIVGVVIIECNLAHAVVAVAGSIGAGAVVG